MKNPSPRAGLLLAWPFAALAQATAPADDGPVKAAGVVVVDGRREPSSLPTRVPTTTESVTRAQIDETLNATDSEDALRYLPSLLVRKRYIGDYNHAILSSRASGTGNSARSAVYADGLGPEKTMIVPQNADALLPATDLVKNAHAAGLVVHPWTVRAENYFLPASLRKGDPKDPAFLAQHGDTIAVLKALYAAGVDGVFSDFPALAVAARS